MTKQELKDFIDKVNMFKIKPEIDNLKTASKFVKWIFDNVVHEVEDIIEVEKQVKHEAIQRKAESLLEDDKKIEKFVK